MNDILTSRIVNSVLSGNAAPDLITNNGPQGDLHKLNVPEGFAARLWDWQVFSRLVASGRYAFNLIRTLTPRDGVTAWTNDSEVNRGGDAIAALAGQLVGATGLQVSPHRVMLWDEDIRLVINPRVTGFVQVSQNVGFRLRYKLVRATKMEIAAILFWQNAGEKVE